MDASSRGGSSAQALTGMIAPRHRLADEAYAALKHMIITDELKGGTVISVLAMAERLGISRSPVKEAILNLEQDGFVVCEPFKAPRVMTIEASTSRQTPTNRIGTSRPESLGQTGVVPVSSFRVHFVMRRQV